MYFQAALVNMTQCAAIQYIPDKIRVNAVAPTAIESELLKVFGFPDFLEQISFHRKFFVIWV